MKFLANENFPQASVDFLKRKGFDVKAIAEGHGGATDRTVMQMAIQESRTMLTFDSDYGELIFKHNYKPSGGVIYFRLTKYLPSYPGELLESLVARQSVDFDNRLTIVTDIAVRQRMYLFS